ncbi:hypothetical protein MBLNU457_7445t1 [Dothideomycetes sp. NU457]
MANLTSNNYKQSSSSSNARRFSKKAAVAAAPRANIRASAYSVNAVTGELKGFHYSSTSGAGGLRARGSSGSLVSDSSIKSNSSSGSSHSGAANTIAEECERLFCETLGAVFLGEGNTTIQDSLAMGARYNNMKDTTHPDLATRGAMGSRIDSAVLGPKDTGLPTPEPSPDGLLGPRMQDLAAGALTEHHDCAVDEWVEVWDYAGGLRFRGFVASQSGVRTLFVFFDHQVMGKDLKKGLMSLLELGGNADFECSGLVICLDRLGNQDDVADLTRDLGWVGFELVTLDAWSAGTACTSNRWLFLGMEV